MQSIYSRSQITFIIHEILTLGCILAFKPYFRISVDEALAHPFFNTIRTKQRGQDKKISAKEVIVTEFDL